MGSPQITLIFLSPQSLKLLPSAPSFPPCALLSYTIRPQLGGRLVVWFAHSFLDAPEEARDGFPGGKDTDKAVAL